MQYLSPEQTGRIGRIVDYRTDIYSMGCVLYQLLTGAMPLEGCGTDSMQLVHAILTRVPPSPHRMRPTKVPLMLSSFIMKYVPPHSDRCTADEKSTSGEHALNGN
jgi:histidine kinase